MQTPPHVMPDGLSVVGLMPLDQLRDLAAEDVCNRAATASDRVGIADAFRTIRVLHANRDELESFNLAMRAVRQCDGERDPVVSGLDRSNTCHFAPLGVR